MLNSFKKISALLISLILIFPQTAFAYTQPNPQISITNVNDIIEVEKTNPDTLTQEKYIYSSLVEPLVMLNGEFKPQYKSAYDITLNYTLIPVNLLSEQFGFTVRIDKTVIIIEKDGHKYIFTIGSSQYLSDGIRKEAPTAPFIKNDVAYIPVRTICDETGLELSFFASTGLYDKFSIISIDSKIKDEPTITITDAVETVKTMVYNDLYVNKDMRDRIEEMYKIDFPDNLSKDTIQNYIKSINIEYKGTLGKYYIINILKDCNEGFLIDRYSGKIYGLHDWSVVILNINESTNTFMLYFQ